MNRLTRFGVSIDAPLLRKFDSFISRAGYVGRSEAFRDLIRARLVEEEIQDSAADVFGVLTLVYDHHRQRLEEKLTEIQHDHHHHIITTTHVHLDHHQCLEVILLKGKVGEVKHISAAIASLKGVQHTKLALTSKQESRHA